jgi:hypothetical protein
MRIGNYPLDKQYREWVETATVLGVVGKRCRQGGG